MTDKAQTTNQPEKPDNDPKPKILIPLICFGFAVWVWSLLAALVAFGFVQNGASYRSVDFLFGGLVASTMLGCISLFIEVKKCQKKQ